MVKITYDYYKRIEDRVLSMKIGDMTECHGMISEIVHDINLIDTDSMTLINFCIWRFEGIL